MDARLRIVRLRQPIDTERLVPRRPLPATPRRALLLGSYLQGEARRLIIDTWSSLGVEVVQVGQTTHPTLHPEDDISAADIVVGKGRAVLDAMSCGRPAYVYDAYGSDGWVTADSYADLEADSIAGQAYPGIVDAARLRADLARYDPTMGHVNRTLVLKHHQARTHAQELVQLFGEVAPVAAPRVTEARELARLVRLRWRAEGELHVVRAAFHAVENGRRRRARRSSASPVGSRSRSSAAPTSRPPSPRNASSGRLRSAGADARSRSGGRCDDISTRCCSGAGCASAWPCASSRPPPSRASR